VDIHAFEGYYPLHHFGVVRHATNSKHLTTFWCAASERRCISIKRFKEFYLQASARIWP
jgi:hypothetical protein